MRVRDHTRQMSKLIYLTFLFSNILEGKGQTGVLPLNNADLSKRALTHHSQEAEMVQVDYNIERSAPVSDSKHCTAGYLSQKSENQNQGNTHAHCWKPPVSLANFPFRPRSENLALRSESILAGSIPLAPR